MRTIDSPEKVDIAIDGEVVKIAICGNITDESDLTAAAKIRARRVIIDLGRFGRMTSCGVVLWIEMIDELCANAEVVRIENAPHGFLQQYAMIAGLAASARIESIL